MIAGLNPGPAPGLAQCLGSVQVVCSLPLPLSLCMEFIISLGLPERG